MNDHTRTRIEAATTVVLVAVTLAAVRGMRGILAPGTGLGRLVVAALVVHAVCWACRHYKVPAGLPITLGVVLLLVAWLGVPSTTVGGIPWAGTWRVVVHDIGAALEAIRTTPVGSLAPEPSDVVEGRLLIALLVVGLCSLLADQAAFRVRGSFLALAPSFSLVLVGAVRGTSQYRAGFFAAYLVVALGFLILHHADMSGHGLAAGPALLASLAPGAAILVVAAVLAAVVVAPRVPGFGEPAVVGAATTGGRSTGSGAGTISISPMIDLRPSLVDRPAAELFTVRSDAAPSYWRLTSLDDFDGRVWKAGLSTESFPDDVPFSTRNDIAQQNFQIGPLNSEWLPAAYRAQSATTPARLADNDSFSLRADGETSVGARYQVTSLVITPSASRLLTSQPVSGPSPAATRYLSLPAALPKRIAEEARRATAVASSRGPYAVARSLQDWFRDNFTYDLKVAAGNGTSALERFLFTTKRGYCEQFAGAYAVMARALGLPARVAVGFTAGELRDDGRYHVQGVHAHAWPEVFLQGAGWVAFEPTPGRGMPGAQGYTGVAPAQADPIRIPPTEPGTVTTTPESPATSTPTTDPGSPETTVPGDDSVPTTAPDEAVPTTAPSIGQPGAEPSKKGSVPLPVLLVLGAVATLATPPAMVRAVRRRRRHARLESLTGANAEVLAAWWDAADALSRSGLGRRPHETMLDHARRATGDDRLPAAVAEPVLVLAGRAGTAAYGSCDLGSDVVAESRQAAAAVASALRRATPLPRRLLGGARLSRPRARAAERSPAARS